MGTLPGRGEGGLPRQRRLSVQRPAALKHSGFEGNHKQSGPAGASWGVVSLGWQTEAKSLGSGRA